MSNLIQFANHIFDNTCYNFTKFQLDRAKHIEQLAEFQNWCNGPHNSEYGSDHLGPNGGWPNGPRKPGPVCFIYELKREKEQKPVIVLEKLGQKRILKVCKTGE